MKLATKVLNLLEKINYEAGDTTLSEDGHLHKTSMDVNGNGKTIQTLAYHGEDHVHEIKSGKVLDSGHGHEHEIGA
jgi:general stress protein 26